MKRFLFIVFFIAAAAVVGYSVKYLMTPLDSVNAVVTTEEKSISSEGFIVHDERVYYSGMNGTVYHNAAEGARVAKDSLISTVYSGGIDSSILKKLRNLDKKIEAETAKDDSYSSGYISVENEIASRSLEVIDASRNNDISLISEYKDDINSLRSGGSITREDRLGELWVEKSSLEMGIGVSKSEIYADMSGVFTTYLDGLEGILLPDNEEAYTPEFIRSIKTAVKENKSSSSVQQGSPVCKLVNNHVWYTVFPVPTEKISKYSTGTSVYVRFKNMANTTFPGVISYISGDDGNGWSTVTVKISQYFENAFSARAAEVDLIFESYTGYKVPTQAIYTGEDGSYSVVGAIGRTQYKCDCNILYSDTDEAFVMIESTEDAENKLSKMDRIIIGEK